jgi:Cys-tRNA(Pro) deacylase
MPFAGLIAIRLSELPLSRKATRVGETPATLWLRRHSVPFTEHVYEYVERGGTAESAKQLGIDEHEIVKTLVMQDERAQPLIVLMHGDRQVSTRNLARQIGAKSVEPCEPGVAQRHSGYAVGGTSPFATRKAMPVWVEASVLELPRICINGGRRGFLVGLSPDVLTGMLGAKPVHCAL